MKKKTKYYSKKLYQTDKGLFYITFTKFQKLFIVLYRDFCFWKKFRFIYADQRINIKELATNIKLKLNFANKFFLVSQFAATF